MSGSTDAKAAGRALPTAATSADRERAIYDAYLNEIVPLISAIEVYDNEFPAEILNEVRSIFTHFARCKLAEDEGVVSSNLEKAERHLKRLRFDCCKYVAAMHSVRVGKLLDSYSPKVLAGVNDGAFVLDVNHLMKTADEAVIQAKAREAAGDEAAALEGYSSAADSYVELERLISDSREALLHAQALYGTFEADVTKSGNIGIAVGVIGVLVGIAGIVAGAIL